MAKSKGKRPAAKKPDQQRVGVSEIDVSLSADKKTLTLAYGGRADLTVELTTVQVDEMLSAIAKWRNEMLPAHPDLYAPVAHVTAIRDPRWYAEPELSRGGSLLHVRHYGFGWLSFWLPKDGASKLASLLHAQVAEQDKPPPQTKN